MSEVWVQVVSVPDKDAYEIELRRGWNIASFDGVHLMCLYCGREMDKVLDPEHMDEACLKSSGPLTPDPRPSS